MSITAISHHQPLSAAHRDLLRLLDQRQTDLVWLSQDADGSIALVVWNARSNSFEQLDLSLSTGDIDRLDEQGALVFGRRTSLPAPFANHTGWPLTLTAEGRSMARDYTFVRAA